MTKAASLENDPAAFWNGPAADRWVRLQVVLDPLMAPFGRAAMDAASLGAGERVLDVGAGCGATTLELAGRVGPKGHVVAVDVSAPMLAVARARVAEAALTNVELREGDAAVLADPTPFDLVYSRFGWMFFADPIAALTHLRTQADGAGRLAFVTWRALAENEWASIPLDAVAPLVGAPAPSPPGSPGPFAFADPQRIHHVLGAAGWTAITVTPFDHPIPVGGGGGGLDGAVTYTTQMGPAARLLADAGLADDQALRERVFAALRTALTPHLASDGSVKLRGATWVVTARPG